MEGILPNDIVIIDQYKRNMQYQMAELFCPQTREVLKETVRS